MKSIRSSSVGTTDSNDCLVTIQPANGLELTIESTVIKRYGDHIRSIAQETLKSLDFTQGAVQIIDHGALDYCIKARVTTAARRAGEPQC